MEQAKLLSVCSHRVVGGGGGGEGGECVGFLVCNLFALW